MKKLEAFQHGDGAHRGLSDWYEDGEAELKAALEAHEPFDTGWYSSKHEIASARIRSEDGVTIKVDVSVSDDFDTEGSGYVSTKEWTLSHVADAISIAWDNANEDRDDNQEYEGFSVLHHSAKRASWVETYIVNIGSHDTPPGDNYHWWGWQYDEGADGQGMPLPDLPLPAAAAFENWARRWVCGETQEKSLRIGAWEVEPWRAAPTTHDDPNDYRGMGWVGDDGRP